MPRSEALTDYESMAEDISQELAKKTRKRAVADLKKFATKLLAAANVHEGQYASAEKACRTALKDYQPKIGRLAELERQAKDAKGAGKMGCEKELKALERACAAINRRAGKGLFALEMTLEPVFFAANDVQDGCGALLVSAK